MTLKWSRGINYSRITGPNFGINILRSSGPRLSLSFLVSVISVIELISNHYTTSTSKNLILRTGAVVELWRPQGWRTHEHIGCHQSLGIRVWRSKMSRTSRVQAEWPVELKCDFNIIRRELSRATLLFSLVFIEPSGTIELIHQKSPYKKSSSDILEISRQVSKQVQKRSMTPRPMPYPACQQYDWYESINKPAITTPLSPPRRWRRKNPIEKTFLTTARCSPHE